jgi:all-trans-8'-apo-beta-carotenal 15,15'-oxygenase
MTNTLEKTTNKSYDQKEWQGGYRSQPNEYEYWIEDIEGEIPTDLRGTFFRNGPGLLDINGQQIHHPFDGDGMINAFTFDQGKVHYRNRFVQTEGYVAEKKAGKILYRGVFGTQKPGGWWKNIFDLKGKNIANTNVIYWAGKLLALWEGAEPYSLQPKTLETNGIEHLGGLLKPGQAFSAHPRIEKTADGQNILVNFSVKPGVSSSITIFEFATDGQVLKQHSHSFPGFAFLHDMAITPNYCIFLQNPVSLEPLPYVLGLRGAAQCLKFAPNQPTKIIIIPRNGKDQMQIIETAPCFVYHHANAWEKDGKIYLDSICYESFTDIKAGENFLETDFDNIPIGQLWRFNIDLASQQASHQVLNQRSCEFPVLHPAYVGQENRYLYMGATHDMPLNAPLQAVLKIDHVTGEQQLWSAAPHGFVGEPIFVPRPNGEGEDDGWLLVLTYDGRRQASDLIILDAQNLNKEPIARLHLKHHIPFGLHGSFTPVVF